MFYVKVQGSNLKELAKGLRAKLVELEGRTEITGTPSKVEIAFNKSVDDGEMEEVESPYTNSAPSIGGEIGGTTPAPQGELDAEGLPWDERIHASSRNKVANGTWRTKRGVDTNLVYQVKAELRAAQQTVTATVISQPTYNPPAIVHEQQTTPALPVMGAALPQMNSGHTLQTFIANFPMIVAGLLTEGKLSAAYVNQLCEFFKVPQIHLINDAQKETVFNGFVETKIIVKVG